MPGPTFTRFRILSRTRGMKGLMPHSGFDAPEFFDW